MRLVVINGISKEDATYHNKRDLQRRCDLRFFMRFIVKKMRIGINNEGISPKKIQLAIIDEVISKDVQ